MPIRSLEGLRSHRCGLSEILPAAGTAALTLPLVLRTLQLSLGARFPEHRRLARVTFPIWMYVSLTGVAVYVMLYHLAPHRP